MAASIASNITDTRILEDVTYHDMKIAFFFLKRICPLVIAIIGTFGNTVSLLITTRKEYRGISTMVYMSGLAILDILFCCYLWLLGIFVCNGFEWEIPNRRMMNM